ncbi:MAG: hypothetical protein IPL83_10960 [Bdellovibrionales bacterium]|nr:hypothetical protein [Bdellovibrionales bacterium]
MADGNILMLNLIAFLNRIKNSQYVIPILIGLVSVSWVFFVGMAEDRLDMPLIQSGGWQIFKGRIPYLDFGISTGPVTYMLQAIGFRLSPTIIGGILPAAFLNGISVFLISRYSQQKKWGLISTIGLAGLFSISIFSYNGRLWYNETAALFGLFPVILLVLVPEKFQALNYRYYLLSGACCAASFLTKQDMGALSIILVFTFLMFLPGVSVRKRFFGIGLLASSLIVFAIWILYPVIRKGQFREFLYWFNFGQAPHASRLGHINFNIFSFLFDNWAIPFNFGETTQAYFLVLVAFFSEISFRGIPKCYMDTLEFAKSKATVMRAYKLAIATGVLVAASIVTQVSGGYKFLQPPTAVIGAIAFSMLGGSSISKALRVFFVVCIGFHFYISSALWQPTKWDQLVPKPYGPLKGELLHPSVFKFYLLYCEILNFLEREKNGEKINALMNHDILFMDERIKFHPGWMPLYVHKGISLFPREVGKFQQYISSSNLDLIVTIEEPLFYKWAGHEYADPLFKEIHRNFSFVAEIAMTLPIGRPEKMQVFMRNSYFKNWVRYRRSIKLDEENAWSKY